MKLAGMKRNMNRSRLDILPLTKTQQNSLEEGLSGHGPGAWLVAHELKGPLNIKRLKQAVIRLSYRTSIFRRSYVKYSGEWSMVIGPEKESKLNIWDLRGQSDNIIEIIRNFRYHNFRPQSSPQARFHLFQLEDSWLLVFNAASWLIDRYSLTSIYSSLSEEYHSNHSNFESLDLNQADLVSIENKFFESEEAKEARRYWLSLLRDKQTRFTTSHSNEDLTQSSIELDISKKVGHSLISVAEELSIPMSIVETASLHLYISYLTEQKNIMTMLTSRIGLPSNQNSVSKIGFSEARSLFISNPKGNLRLRDFLLDTCKLNEYSNLHANYPISKIIDVIRLDQPNFSEFTNIGADYTYLPYNSLHLDGIEAILRTSFSRRRPSKDVSFKLRINQHNKLAIRTRHPDLLPAIKQSLPILLHRLENLHDELDHNIGDLSWMDREQRKSILIQSATPKNKKIAVDFLDRLVNKTKENPNHLALKYKEKSLTYKELMAAADTLALRLRQLIKESNSSEPLFGICLPRGCEMIIALVGILRSGAGYLPLDPTNPRDRIDYILKDAKPVGVIIDDTTISIVEAVVNIKKVRIPTEENWREILNEPIANTLSESEAIAYIIYTSGTTGLPKGVVIERGNLAAFISAAEEIASGEPGQRWQQFASINFDASILEISSALARGSTLVIAPSEIRSNPEALFEFLEQEGITHAFIPPAMLRLLPRRKLPALTDIYVGGEASDDLTVSFWSRATRLWNVYGPTETTVICSAKLMTSQLSATDLGGPLPGYSMFVLDQKLEPVPPGIIGEIYIAGNAVSRGYLNRSTTTAERFFRNPFGEGRLYRTGDLARHFPSGELEYLGRNDFQVKIRGFRIELGEVESTIADVNGVTGVFVTVIDEPSGKTLVAWFTTNPEGPEATSLRKTISEQLTHYMVPTYLIKVDTFPVNISGKIDRSRLPMPENIKSEHESEPLTGLESKVQLIWSEILEIPKERIKLDSNFFHLGGHSLNAAIACHKIAAELEQGLSPKTLFENPVLKDFSGCLSNQSKTNQLEPLIATGLTKTRMPGALLEMMLHRSIQNGQDTAYTIVVDIDFESDINPLKLRAAFSELLAGDPIFSSHFLEQEGKTYIKHDPTTAIIIPLLTDTEKQTRINEFRGTSFDLLKAPLWRAEIIINERQSHLLLAINHGIFDGWSLTLMLRELAERYEASVSSDTYNRTAPTMLDYGAWLSSHKEMRDASISYWDKKLSGGSCKTNLPGSSHPGAASLNLEKPINLPYLATCELKELATDLDVTLPPVLFAAYLVWLWRISGQDNLTVGYPYAGRDVLNSERVFGMFVQMGFLRIDIDPEEQFTSLIKRVAKQMIEDRDHLLASPYDAEISSAGAPNILFSLQSGIGLEGTHGTVKFKAHEHPSQASKADIAAILYENSNGELQGRIEYDSAVMEEAEIEPLFECFNHLLNSLAKYAKREISDLPYLSPKQVSQLIEFSGEVGDFREDNTTLINSLRQVIADHPEEIAIESNHEQISYAELDQITNKLAKRIIFEGEPGSEKLIALSGIKSSSLVMATIAILKAGCAYVPIDPNYPAERIEYILKDANIQLMLADADANSVINKISHQQLTLIDPQQVVGKEVDLGTTDLQDINDVEPRSLAYVIYTSGSTGKPKGVMVEHRTIPRMIDAAAELMNFTSSDRMLLLGTLNFDASVLQMFTPLLKGGTLIIPPADAERDPDGLHQLINDKGVTHLVGTPALLRNLPREPLSKLRFMGFGGEAIDTSTASFWAEKTCLYSLYGPTETTVMCSGGRILPGANPRIVGKPLMGYSINLRDQQLQPVPLGAIGELVISGGTARGYLNRYDLTLNRFRIDPDGVDPYQRVYLSGDLGRFLPDGTIEFLGRNDDQIKLRGYRIELGEIEASMQSAPGVTNATAMVRGENDNRMLIGYLTGNEGLDIDEVRQHCQEQLPGYMVPSRFIKLENMPLNPNGKLDRNALPDVSFVSTSEPPKVGLEQKVAAVWQDLLHLKNIGRKDDFFHLGGNSLLAARLQTLLRERCDLEISTANLYAHPTIAGLTGEKKVSEINQAINTATVSIQINQPVAPRSKFKKQPNVLLTGASGFLGVYLLAELQSRAGEIICLARGKSDQQITDNLKKHAERSNLEIDFNQIRVIRGDLSKKGLGLRAYKYDQLTNVVDQIIHCGAWINHLYSYSSLRSANVGSTVELIKLALAGKYRTPLCFISTESAATNLRGISCVEEAILDPVKNQPISDNGYMLSKWVSELILANAVHNHGLDCLIARPGNITGDSRTGFSNYSNNHFWMYTKGCLQMGMAPLIQQHVEMTPVDVLARAIVALVFDAQEGLRVANLSNPINIPWEQFFKAITQITGQEIAMVEAKSWQTKLNEINTDNTLYMLRDLYSENITTASPKVNRSSSQAVLNSLGVSIDSDPRMLAKLYVPYLIEQGFLIP